MNEKPCKKYCCEYFHDGSWWGIEITAYDWADAEIRAKKMSLQLLGEYYATIPAVTTAGFLVRFITWLKNNNGRNQSEGG